MQVTMSRGDLAVVTGADRGGCKRDSKLGSKGRTYEPEIVFASAYR